MFIVPEQARGKAWWRFAVSNDLLGRDRHIAAKGRYISLWERHNAKVIVVVVLNILEEGIYL